jgi:thiol-disulfide isomerase/thioredoxin/mono/diheme cytochrome c family protein
MRSIISITVLSVLIAGGQLFLAPQAQSLSPQERVENFRLLEHRGASHELYYYSDMKAVVVMVQGNGCPIVRNAMPRFTELRDEYAEKGVQFFLLNSNLQDNRRTVSREAEEFGYDIPVLIDDTQIIGESLDLVRTGEVFVLDPQTWSVVYRGALDDRLTYENQKREASEHYLKDALDDMLGGRKVAVSSTDAVGCLINFPARQQRAQHASISYSEEIAPMLADNCVSCHREGGIGPWAMTDYNMVRGFSLMIREVVRTGRMPPWHADPAYGHFVNDRSLTVEETQKLVHWIEAGAPRGAGPDPLTAIDHDWGDWAVHQPELGEPDYIIDIPAVEVPATGVVDYLYHFVPNTVDRDVWVKAAEILPGDRGVLHHVITSFGYLETEGPRKGRLKRQGQAGLRGYVPGMTSQLFPPDTGVFLPADATLEFQMHYTTNGRATVDESKLGIWVYEEPPRDEVFSLILLNGKIRIPPHEKNHKEMAARELPKAAVIYNLLPHAHFRGKASEFSVIYPDGTEEVLLSVPNYDFNWQTTYELAEPKFVPAGTRVVHTTWWDNSAQNPANPDPTIEVTWGEQSWEEMLFGAVLMRFANEAEIAEYEAQQQAQDLASTD